MTETTSNTDETPKRRQRGGQPGNRNALKHGFYSPGMKTSECTDLDLLLRDGVQDEIAMMRVVARRVMIASGEEDKLDLDTACKVLSVLGAASTRLASLLHTQQEITGGADSQFRNSLSSALSDVLKEMRV